MADDFQHSPGAGALFKNRRKKKDKHPEYRGDANVECPCCGESTTYELAAWMKKTRKGSTFMSLSIQKQKEEEDIPGTRSATEPANTNEESQQQSDDNVPF